VAHEIGSFAKPEQIRFTDSLPKTRSGKIMRRLLREIVTSNSVTGDVTTLEDLSGGDAAGGAAGRRVGGGMTTMFNPHRIGIENWNDRQSGVESGNWSRPSTRRSAKESSSRRMTWFGKP